MVVGAFPAAKLGVLAFKQLSKPIANVIKERAKQSPFFRDYIAMPPAQCKFTFNLFWLHNAVYFLLFVVYNWVEVKTKMWALNLGKPTNVPQLNEAMAIELGANLLGEVIIFTIGAGLLIFEYIRYAISAQIIWSFTKHIYSCASLSGNPIRKQIRRRQF